jgi:sugar lactone lactonase YvrE
MKHTVAILIGLVVALTAAFPLAAAPPAPFPDVIPLPNGWRPEGITAGKGPLVYVGSLGTGAIYGANLVSGEGRIVVPPQEGRIAVGLDYDDRSDYIFAAGGAGGAAYVYDAGTGQSVEVYQFTNPGPGTFVNDVVVTRDAAYFTDSLQAVLYKVPLGPAGRLPDASEVEEIPLSGDFVLESGFNANGIAATPDGKSLIIVQSGPGKLYHVDSQTGVATLIDLGGGSVPFGDGLLLEGKTLYVMQNRLNQIAVVQLDPQLTSGEIVSTITDADFDVPTTIAGFGNAIYAVNARFGIASPDTADYSIVRVIQGK